MKWIYYIWWLQCSLIDAIAIEWLEWDSGFTGVKEKKNPV